MKYIHDTSDPQCLGFIEQESDLHQTIRMVEGLNKDLVDSGFDRYQYQAVRRGNKVYVELIGA